VNPTWVREAVRQDPALISRAARHQLERTLDLATWLDIYRPTIALQSASASAGDGRRAA
jgi:asparagine synthase (glutamine-hydrolysing)